MAFATLSPTGVSAILLPSISIRFEVESIFIDPNNWLKSNFNKSAIPVAAIRGLLKIAFRTFCIIV